MTEPCALLIAPGERMAPALAERLRARGLVVHLVTTVDGSAVGAVGVERPPDFVVLAGDASREIACATQLARVSTAVPVVVVDDGRSDATLSGIGTVAEVPRTDDPEALTRRILRAATSLLAARHDRATEIALESRCRLSTLFDPSVVGLPDPATRIGLRGRRLALIAKGSASGDRIAQELRSAGSIVVVVDGSGEGLDLARALAPDVIVVDRAGTTTWARPALRAIDHDVVLRWVPVLPADLEELSRGQLIPRVGLLVEPIDALCARDRELGERARSRDTFVVELASLGPVRILRALAHTGLGLRARAWHPRVCVDVDLAGGVLAGAQAFDASTHALRAEGAAAIGVLLGLRSGCLEIAPAPAPKTANVMAFVDDALSLAMLEEVIVPPSTPPPRLTAEAGATEDAELPSVVEPDEPDTGRYRPGVVERLRQRMRRRSLRVPVAEEELTERVRPMDVVAVPFDPKSSSVAPEISVARTAPRVHVVEAVTPQSADPPQRELRSRDPSVSTSVMLPPSGRHPARMPLLTLAIVAAGGVLAAVVLDTPAPRRPAPVSAPPEHRVETPARSASLERLVPVRGASEPARASARFGPGPDEPLEGDAAAFARLFPIEPGPRSRRGSRTVELRLRAANAARAEGQLVLAEQRYRAVLSIDPTNTRAVAGLARTHLESGDATRAVVAAQQLCRLRAYPNHYVLLGDALLLARSEAAARRAYEHALTLDHRSARARERLERLDADAP